MKPRDDEIRIYYPDTRAQSNKDWIGKPVTVTGWSPYFSQIGKIHGSPLHECRWFGHVKELDMQISEHELLKPGQQKGASHVK